MQKPVHPDSHNPMIQLQYHVNVTSNHMTGQDEGNTISRTGHLPRTGIHPEKQSQIMNLISYVFHSPGKLNRVWN
jgi:hypothetical protein